MTDRPRRVSLRIDRIVSDRIVSDRGLDRAALDAALRRELQAALSSGNGTVGEGGHRPRVEARLGKGDGPVPGRVAQAIIGAVKR